MDQSTKKNYTEIILTLSKAEKESLHKDYQTFDAECKMLLLALSINETKIKTPKQFIIDVDNLLDSCESIVDKLSQASSKILSETRENIIDKINTINKSKNSKQKEIRKQKESSNYYLNEESVFVDGLCNDFCSVIDTFSNAMLNINSVLKTLKNSKTKYITKTKFNEIKTNLLDIIQLSINPYSRLSSVVFKFLCYKAVYKEKENVFSLCDSN